MHIFRPWQKHLESFKTIGIDTMSLICLQETFLDRCYKKDMEKEWSGKLFLYPGTALSKGTAIL